MRKVTCSMAMSVDGYITDADGDISWGTLSEEVFRSSIDEARRVGVHLLGRKLYETMRYWETVDPATLGEVELEWRDLWNPLPKLVFSRTLTEVGASARLADGTVVEEIERLRAEDGFGDIAIGGPELAAQAAAADLIDEYYIRVNPAVVGGGGQPFFAPDGRLVDLDLLSSRTFDCGVMGLRYRVRR